MLVHVTTAYLQVQVSKKDLWSIAQQYSSRPFQGLHTLHSISHVTLISATAHEQHFNISPEDMQTLFIHDANFKEKYAQQFLLF